MGNDFHNVFFRIIFAVSCVVCKGLWVAFLQNDIIDKLKYQAKQTPAKIVSVSNLWNKAYINSP